MPLEAINSKFQSRLFKLFRDFWFFCVIFGFADINITDTSNNSWPHQWYRSLALIATKSPVLLSKEHLKSELHHNSAFKNEQISAAELTEIRNSLSSQLTEFSDTYPIIKYLTFAQCSYLQSVFKLEKLRIQNLSNAYSYQQIFYYLEDITIQKDKAGIWYCILCMANKNFNTYLDVVSKLPKTVERDKDLENMVQFLLVKFNHIDKRLRQLADTLLSRIMDKFSYLLWSEKTLRCLMDITELLASSLNMDTNQVAPEFDIPNTSFKLKVYDTMEGRESTVNDFTQRCSAFLQESLQFAPITAKSHVQNYMLQLQQKGENIYNHSGVSMMLECVMKYSKPRPDAESLDSQSLQRRPDCVKKDFSSFIGQMNEKYTYVGIVQGLCKHNSETQVVKQLCSEMRQSNSINKQQIVMSSKQKQLKQAMLKSAAFLTLMPIKGIHTNLKINFEREILHELSMCCCSSGLFSKAIIEVAIECWSWIISSRPDIEPLVVEEMLNAWQMTVDLRLGMFAPVRDEPNPLAKEEKDVLKPQPPENIDAHRIWLKYLQERLDIAKNKSDFENELFVNLVHKTLAFSSNTGDSSRLDDSCLNRHVSCVGLRFRFLVMALSLLHSSSSLIPNTISKWILRERIYFTAFDYFTVSKRVPTQSYSELREDLKYLVEFWNKIVAEKKYLVNGTETWLNGAETILNNNMILTNNAGGNAGTPDAVSINGLLTETNGMTASNTSRMVNSETYQSLNSGMPNSATITGDLAGLAISNNIQTGTGPINTGPIILNAGGSGGGGGGALSQLVMNTAMFIEPLAAPAPGNTYNTLPSNKSNNNNNNNTIPRNESTVFANNINNTNNNNTTTLSRRNNNNNNTTTTMHSNNKQQQPVLASQQQQSVLPNQLSQSQTETNLNNQQQQQKYFKDYFKKRNLLLCLISHELDHLYSFHNPFNNSSLNLDRIELAINHLKEPITNKEKFWSESVRIAWSITPALAVSLPMRFYHDEVIKKVQSFVKSQPERVVYIPQAAVYLATEQNILNDSIELNNLLIWCRIPALIVLNYFGKGSRGQSLANPITAQFTSKNLMCSKPETLLNYIPQLVQALRYDDFGYVREVIFWLAKHSQLLAHQLIWNLTTNVYRDQDAKIKDPVLGDLIEQLINDIKNSLTGAEKEFFKREFDFFGEITEVSAKIKDKPLGPERKKACEIALRQVKLVNDCYLPSNPDAIVVQILDGTPMQSAAKAPYLARFIVQRIKLSDLEKIGKNGLKIEPDLSLQYKSACIFKVGDDVRQDMLALQIMELLKNVFQREGLELFLFPYRVIATKPGCGVIECVPNSNSRDEIGRKTDIDLYQYFLDKYGGPDTSEFQRARRNFIISMAGYSLFMFLIQIKDRHNGNLMLDEDGHLIHIDFGFMIDSSPGGNLGFEPDMKITTEFGQIMGDINSPSFQWFTELCIKGFLAIRPYRENIITLVSLMLETGLPCFRNKTIETLRARFQPNSNDRDAAVYMINIVNKCYNNTRTNMYDSIQYMQNSIYKPN